MQPCVKHFVLAIVFMARNSIVSSKRTQDHSKVPPQAPYIRNYKSLNPTATVI